MTDNPYLRAVRSRAAPRFVRPGSVMHAFGGTTQAEFEAARLAEKDRQSQEAASREEADLRALAEIYRQAGGDGDQFDHRAGVLATISDPRFLTSGSADLRKKLQEIQSLAFPELQAVPEGAAMVDPYTGQPRYKNPRTAQPVGDFTLSEGQARFHPGSSEPFAERGASRASPQQESFVFNQLGKFAEQGANARRDLVDLEALENTLVRDPGGFASGLRTTAAEWGIPVQGQSERQMALSITKRLAQGLHPPGAGPMTDADAARYMGAMPSSWNDHATNTRIIAQWRQMAQESAEIGGIAQSVAAGERSAPNAMREISTLQQRWFEARREQARQPLSPRAPREQDVPRLQDVPVEKIPTTDLLRRLQQIIGGGQ